MDAISRLRESTKKLLCLVEEIQSKTHSSTIFLDDVPNITNLIKTVSQAPNVLDIVDPVALKKLENQAKYLDSITIEGEDDDCSVYKRLTRKCHCLNRMQYNDLIIHFNEETRYCMSTLGEVVKNIRTLKKFLYMGGDYSRNALLFLNEGLITSAHKEKVDIIMACSHADICNVFDDSSIVTVCISWPFKLPNFGDCMTQSSAAGVLYKLAQVEEGRRYLNFSTKIANDIKQVLKKHSSKLEQITLECLHNTLHLLSPPLARNMNVTYYCKAEEGVGNKTLHALENCRHYMTLEEIFTHIELLQQMTTHENTRKELTQYLPRLLCLFKHLLLDYDNSDMNVILIDILTNIVTKPANLETEQLKTFVVTDIATEPISTRHAFNQVPSRRALQTCNKSKLGIKPTNKSRLETFHKVGGMLWSTKQANKPKTSVRDIAPIKSRSPVIIISAE